MKKSMFSSVENFRDMGGTPMGNGKKLKKGLIFRSGSLNKVSEEDKNAINALNIGKVFDYRDLGEITKDPDFVGNFEYVNIPALKNLDEEIATKEEVDWGTFKITKESADAYKKRFLNSYVQMPIDSKAYKATLLALNEHKPILFHCASGKDRTGVGAMLITLALGGTKEQTMKDYLDSNEYRKKENDELFSQIREYAATKGEIDKDASEIGIELLEYLMYTKEIFLEASFNSIFSKYATFDDYLLEEYGITKEMTDDWKAFYLE